jgi:glycosidase
LAFFERDPIDWRPHPLGELYRKLFALKRDNTALWNAAWGARMVNAPNNTPTQVLSFVRQNERDRVFAVFNFSDRPQTVTFHEALHHGSYTDFFSGERVAFDSQTRLEIERWGYRVYVRQ